MKHLWQMGFKRRAIVQKETIENAIFYCAGGDHRTISRYLGFQICIQKGNAVEPSRYKYIPGYLERLRYVEKVGQGRFMLRHEAVPLNYHYKEEFSSAPFVSNSEGVAFKEEMCVSESENGIGPLGPTNELLTTTTTQHTHKSEVGESNLTSEELRILTAKPKEAV